MQRIGMMPLVIIGLGLFFAVAPAFSQNAYTGKASGTLTVDGKSTPLRYAHMVEVDNVEEVGLLLAGPRQYQVIIFSDRSFRAPVLSEPPVKEQWAGKAALDSPPVQALREYLDAAQKGDVATLHRLTAKTQLPYLNKPGTLQFLKDADASTLAEQVKRVVVRGDTAMVMAVNEAPDYSQVAMSLVRENGAWKLYWP
jgi:hypothetical protein